MSLCVLQVCVRKKRKLCYFLGDKHCLTVFQFQNSKFYNAKQVYQSFNLKSIFLSKALQIDKDSTCLLQCWDIQS